MFFCRFCRLICLFVGRRSLVVQIEGSFRTTIYNNSDDAIPSEIGAKSDPEPEDNSSFGVEEESSGGRHAIDESEYEKQKRLIHGTPCNLPKGQKASERARKNAEDDGYELEEGKTYRVTHQMDVWCKKKNEE